MTATLRKRAEHAARYGKNLFIPASDIVELLDELETARAEASHDRRVHAIAAVTPCTCTAQRQRAEHALTALDRVRAIHQPLDAIHEQTGQMRQVCTGCGTDAGNWQTWPCPTVRALEGAAALAEGGEPR